MKLNLIAATIAAAFLAEGMADAGCSKLNKLQALAADVGGTGFAFEEGACSVEIKGPEAAQQYLTALDGEECVEGYDVTHDGEETDEEDILTLPVDTVFNITAYLNENHISYAAEETDAEDMMEAALPDNASLVDRFEAFAGTPLKVGRMTVKGFPFDMNDSDGESLDMDAVDSDAAGGLAKALRAAGFKAKRVGKVGILVEGVEKQTTSTLAEGHVRGIPVDDYGVHLDEVAKKVVVSSKGAKRVKMQCPKGFKFNAEAKACVKIAGDELAVRRKASVKALISRKAGGNALKARAAVKTKKAMNFRKAMGL
jgi:hypothetical protein